VDDDIGQNMGRPPPGKGFSFGIMRRIKKRTGQIGWRMVVSEFGDEAIHPGHESHIGSHGAMEKGLTNLRASCGDRRGGPPLLPVGEDSAGQEEVNSCAGHRKLQVRIRAAGPG
jgi:hypothetical protein